jgi:hypothetical protein
LRNTVSSVAGAGNYAVLMQYIENVSVLAGKTVTVSFWAKADAAKNITSEFVQNFGTGGSPSASVDSIGVTTFALTSTWKKFTTTVTIPSITGKTKGTAANDRIELVFWFDSGATNADRNNALGQQSGTFDIAQVQIEEGVTATNFEYRPYGIELSLCQRYYSEAGTIRMAGYHGPGGIITQYIAFPCQMRTTPTLSWKYTGTNSNISAANLINPGLQGVGLQLTAIATGGTQFNDYVLAASAEL